MSTPNDEAQRAWVYYQHADNLQHQRHNIFILAQTILVAAYTAFAQAPWYTKVLIASIGALYALLWWRLAERVSKGMDNLSDKLKNADPIYNDYLDSLGPGFSGRTILNQIIPISTLIAWVVMLAKLLLCPD